MRILLIDDNPYDRELIIRRLQSIYPAAEYVEIAKRNALEEALKQAADLVFLDYDLKWATGLVVLKQIRAQMPDLPVVMVTDSGNEEIAAEGMKAGLDDYVLKKHLSRLPMSAQRCLERVKVHQEREALEAQKSQLVALTAHELRNPLACIKGYTDLLQAEIGDTLSEQQQEYFKLLSSSTDQLMALINDLLDLSHLESGLLQLDCQALDLQEIIEEVANSFRPLLKAKQQQLVLEITTDPHLRAWGEGKRVKQILGNLLSNAHKYTRVGGSITIRTSLQETMIRIAIQDTGIGMSPVELAQLFRKFFRARNAMNSRERGTGLGLAITLSLVELHGGQMDVISSPGVGTTMAFTLPTTVPASDKAGRAAAVDKKGL